MRARHDGDAARPMKECDPIGNDRRRARKERVLGDDPHCVRCGIADFDALLPLNRRLLEDHHVLGRASDPRSTIPLCRNCHAWMTERLADAGVSMEEQPTRVATLAQQLRALSATMYMLGDVAWKAAERAAALASPPEPGP